MVYGLCAVQAHQERADVDAVYKDAAAGGRVGSDLFAVSRL